MKKIFKALFLGLLLVGSVSAMAQSLSVNQSDYTQSSYSFTAPQLLVQPQQAGGATFASVTFEGATPSTQLGRPNLPLATEMIEIPLCSNVKVSLSNIQTKELEPLKYPMMPVQPAPSKSDRGPLPFVMDSAFYATNAFSNNTSAWVEVMGVARDRNVALLRVSPLSYNPVTGQLNVITSMDITLTFEDADIAATQEMHRRYYSPDFSVCHKLLSTLPAEKEVSQVAPLHYLIVSHSSFRGQLDNFINWKKRQGFKVTVGYTDDAAVGTTSSSIATYIKSFYDNASDSLPAPTFLLLVGDHQQIPAFNARCTTPSSNHVTDLYFVTWTNDDIPDCYQGRFSARTVAELTPQLEKTILYESYGFTDDSYLNKAILIAGVDYGYTNDNAYTYADPAMDYVAKYYVAPVNGYTDIKYYKNNTSFAPTGVTVTGSSQSTASANAIKNYFNQGCGWVNYSAHGDDESWANPSFNASEAAVTTNTGKPAVMIGNCCLSGRFNTSADACFGEALLRRGNNAGAVSYIGCTNSSYWPHDFCWEVGRRSNIANAMNATYDAENLGMYDRLFHTHNEPFSAWHVTAGSMSVAGNMAVQTYGTYTLYYWEIYELFGDPSLMPWLTAASEMPVSASSAIVVGTESYNVTAAPYAYVALTSAGNHNVVAAAYADASGVATLHIPSSLTPGEYELAVWAQNLQPVFRNVSVIAPNGPYVIVTSAVSSNGELHPDETSTFDVTLTNIGNASASQGLITVATSSSKAAPIQSQTRFSGCNPGDTVTLTGVLPVYISSQSADGDQVRLDFYADFGGDNQSCMSVPFIISSSNLQADNATVTPALAANTSSTISCAVTNNGSDTSSAVTFSLVSQFGLLTAQAADQSVAPMVPGQQVNLSFDVTMGANAPTATIPFYLYATTDQGTFLLKEFSLRCGENFIEDFETGNFNSFSWTHNSNPWEVTNSDSHGGTYCARSKTGLSNNSTSKLSIAWTSAIDDTIRFSYKVSSERRWDVFTFSIDGSDVMEASGQEGWTQAAFPVSAGTHIFAFQYVKDVSASSGSDCAWIDDIQLPFNGDRCSFLLDSVCQGTDYSFGSRTIATPTAGVFSYVDSSTAVHQYLSLVVLEEPQVEIEVVEFGGCMLLKASGATTYEWSTGETGDYIVVCPTETTHITVTGYRGGCSSTASVGLLGVQDIDRQPAVALYPNPARNSVTVAADGIRSIELVNLMGQILLRRQTNGSQALIDLQGLPAGIYFVKVETNNSVVVKKLVRK